VQARQSDETDGPQEMVRNTRPPSVIRRIYCFPGNPAGKKTTKEESDLFSEVREILSGVDVFMPSIPRAAAAGLYHRLVLFQNVHRDMKFVSVRLIRNQSLFLVEGGLRLYLWPERSDSPTEGYRLAASYCEHYDPRYGNGLNGPSTNRIEEIASFILAFEAHEASNLGA